MLSTMRSKKSGIFGWIIIALLILGLGAFGFTDILTGGSASSVARVGKTDITVTEYRLAFENRVNAIQQQYGLRLDAQTAQAQGVDQQVLGELLRAAALKDEATRLGLSMPDQVVQRALLETPGLGGTSGEFDAANYQFFLNQRGLNAQRFEQIIRDSETVALLGEVIADGAVLPPVAADALLSYLGEERSVNWVLVPAQPMTLDLAGDDALQAYLDENADRFRTPEQRAITYAYLTPQMLAADMDFDEEALRAEYERDIQEFQAPQRRIVDRLAFSDEAAAQTALEAIESGQTTLGDQAVERGLQRGDISLGLISETQLARSARAAVFGPDATGIVGPVTTDLGPTLFSINAIIPASETAFADARDDLRQRLALAEAEEIVISESLRVEELIAGGATLEQIAEESAYALGTATVTQDQSAELPSEVIEEAFASDIGADRDQIEAGDLSFYAVRVDEVIAPALPPLAEIRTDVADAWRADAARDAAMERAQELQTALSDGLTLSTLAQREELELQTDEGLTRDAENGFLSPEATAAVFEAEQGTAMIFEDEAGAILLTLTDVTPYELEDENAQTLRNLFTDQTRVDVERDMIGYFANAIADERGIVVNQAVLDQIVQSLR
ncbi:peptidylprolyl isomerase [Pontivivens nitratireducens]|uniref:PpiC domain-containing protein n=1 Tax=Pontivivens nitratireducens TaxID=2758038 RepID=A0A6G7VMI1_9RHOB|nr:peptidylprolyl isomerase [Pontibrevibacter nitratireducens]QIK41214.1 hypothetical protein G8E03_10795 [Pontibrevibacter nitratireducens]